MKKKLFLLIILFLLTGCKVNYNLSINEDYSLDETVSMTGTDNFFDTYYRTSKKNVLEMILEDYKDKLNDNKYLVEMVNDDVPYIKATKKYQNIDEFSKNTIFFENYFDEIKCTKNGDILTIETIGFNPNELDDPERFYVKDLEIAIKSIYKVKNDNASHVDKFTNTYYFKMGSNTEDFKILMEIDLSSKYSYYLKLALYFAIIFVGIIIYLVYQYKKNKRK